METHRLGQYMSEHKDISDVSGGFNSDAQFDQVGLFDLDRRLSSTCVYEQAIVTSAQNIQSLLSQLRNVSTQSQSETQLSITTQDISNLERNIHLLIMVRKEQVITKKLQQIRTLKQFYTKST